MTSPHVAGPADLADLADLGDLSRPAAHDHALVVLNDRTKALLAEARTLDDDAVRAPSLCPGWSRGHVLTHVARNADAMVNLVTSARTGVPVPMYASPPARDQEIEAGAGRSAAVLVADLEDSAARFLSALEGLPADRRAVVVKGRAGATLAAHDLVWMRLREVAYHHVDLEGGTTFADLPGVVVARGLSEAAGRLAGAGASAMTWHVTDPGPAPARLDVAGGGLTVRGSAADLLGWATGRTTGTGLEIGTDGDAGTDRAVGSRLPGLPAWG